MNYKTDVEKLFQEELLLSNARIEKRRVFFPLYLKKNTALPGDGENIEFNSVNAQEVQGTNNINPKILARRFTQTLANSWIQVGEDASELVKIVQQHNYQKYYAGVYAVEVLMDEEDILGEFKCSDLCRTYNIPHEQAHCVVKQNANVVSARILSLNLILDHFSKPGCAKPIIERWQNPHPKANQSHYNCVSAFLRLYTFLNDDVFWHKHKHLNFTPPGINELSSYIYSSDDLDLDDLQTIVAHVLPKETRASIFKKIHQLVHYDEFTKMFLDVVRHAKTIYEIVEWIDKNYQPISRSSHKARPG